MLSLVNYGSSGESEDEENSENESHSAPVQANESHSAPVQANESHSAPVQANVNVGKSTLNEGDNFDDDEWSSHPSQEVKESNKDISSFLPPIQNQIATKSEESSEDISGKLPPPVSDLKSIPWDQLSKLTYKSRAIRIMAPSIPEEVEEKKEKKLPSKIGSGLLAMLPKPKNEFVAKPHSLKPTTVTKLPPSKPKLIPKPKLPTPSKKAEESDSDGEDGDVDFFSLSKPDSPVKTDLPNNFPLPTTDFIIPNTPSSSNYPESIPIPDSNPPLQSETPSSYFIDTSGNQNETEQSSSNDFVSFQQNNSLHLDQEALAALCGSRGIKRRARNDDFQIIDIKGSELTPDSQELLAKNLTSDQPRMSHRKNKDGPTSQQKRKHQIMYLAHQAKEQELELQNTWANNRMTKKQTQAKYGF